MIKLLINGKETPFEITKFPDGTSQVWKIEHESLPFDQGRVIWLFENESELFHVCQLAQLLARSFSITPTLFVPYLPYGRQDKTIANNTSFALRTFVEVVRSFFHRIETYDPHSDAISPYYQVSFISPKDFHKSVLNHDVVCFPDKGAATRYKWSFEDTPVIYCDKVRDQLTGNITGLFIVGAQRDTLTDKKILIVDDICDGGMTFIKVAEALQTFNPKQVDLAVSHGLFSKGKACLYDAGIANIYTTNSLLRNPEGFKVW